MGGRDKKDMDEFLAASKGYPSTYEADRQILYRVFLDESTRYAALYSASQQHSDFIFQQAYKVLSLAYDAEDQHVAISAIYHGFPEVAQLLNRIIYSIRRDVQTRTSPETCTGPLKGIHAFLRKRAKKALNSMKRQAEPFALPSAVVRSLEG